MDIRKTQGIDRIFIQSQQKIEEKILKNGTVLQKDQKDNTSLPQLNVNVGQIRAT